MSTPPELDIWDIKKSRGGWFWLYHKHYYEEGIIWQQFNHVRGTCSLCGKMAPEDLVRAMRFTNEVDGWRAPEE